MNTKQDKQMQDASMESAPVGTGQSAVAGKATTVAITAADTTERETKLAMEPCGGDAGPARLS